MSRVKTLSVFTSAPSLRAALAAAYREIALGGARWELVGYRVLPSTRGCRVDVKFRLGVRRG